MGYLLRMSDEIHDWLDDLRDSDPPAAMLVGQALVALMEEGDGLGPPLVIGLPDPGPSSYPPEALDDSYQERLSRLQIVRRFAVDAATLVTEIRDQIAGLESLQATLADQRRHAPDTGDQAAAGEAETRRAAAEDQLAELRRLLSRVTEAEQELSRKNQRLQAQLDAYRTRKEVLKATYRVAEVEQEVEGGEAPVNGLMELRPDAPGGGDISVIYAVEPAGTALLIAVLEGREAVREQRAEAVAASAEVLRGVREGGAPEAAARGFDDTQAFLDEFFPGGAAEVEAGAAALAARNRARTLAEQRNLLGLTQAQVAERMGVRQERVSAIERAEPGATEVRTLAGYVAALGGRLEIIADFGGERVLLR